MNKEKKYWDLFRDNMEYFLIYSCLGWIYESIWCDVIYHQRGFLNRGFLFGPWLPIYGLGFFIILGIFKLIRVKKPVLVFITGAVVATLAELVASYIMEPVIGNFMWDYTGYFMNYDGRIALVPGLMFGFLIWGAICVIQPAVIKCQDKYRNNRIHNILFILILILFSVDLICRIWCGSNFKSSETNDMVPASTDEAGIENNILSGTWQTASIGYEDNGSMQPEFYVQFTGTEVIYGHMKDGEFVTDHSDTIKLMEESEAGGYRVQAEAANGVRYTYQTSESDKDILEYFESWNEDDFPETYRGGASLSR